jgi:hypothetical protein
MRYREEGRVQQGSEFTGFRPALTPGEVRDVQALLRVLLSREANYDELVADLDNVRLARAIVHRFSTNASRTITGFFALDLDSQLRVIVNVGANDLVLANNSASSSAANRILCHTGANITLGPNESALIFYDRTSARVRTVGFV